MRVMVRTFLVILAGVTQAHADFVPYGPPMDGNSWSQQFTPYSTGANNGALIDLIAIRMVSPGDEFKHTGGEVAMSNFANYYSGVPQDWSTAYNSATLAVAVGDPIESMRLNINFEGSSSDPLSFEVLMLSDRDFTNGYYAAPGTPTRILVCGRYDWTGSGWIWTNCPVGVQPWMTRDQLNNLIVPVPAASTLGLVGLVVTTWFRRQAM